MRRAVGRHPGEAGVFRQGAACHDCANGIEQDVDLNARFRAVRQRFGKLLAHFSGPINVSLQVDRLLGVADRRQHCWKNLIAVNQTGDAVAGDQGRPQQLTHGT